jgi:beta-phosphoglucomutase
MTIATLFDFNGVLVDDEHVHLEAFREVLAQRGVSLTDAEYTEKYLGFDDAGAFRAILADHQLPATDDVVHALIDEKVPVYMRRIATELRVFEGAADLVRRRATLGVVGIVSGALRHEIEHCLRIMNVREHVSFVVSAEDTRMCKPDPEGYVIGVSKLAKNSRAVVVEDSVAGVHAAKSAGLRCAAVTHSYGRAELVGAGADVVTDNLLELTDVVLDGTT